MILTKSVRFESLVTSAEIYQNFEYDATDL